MALSTVRIPELAPLTVDLPLALTDKIPIYIASENKTKRVDLQTLNTFFNTGGGGGSHSPVVYGGRMIYVVPGSAAGTDTAPIPSIAGQDFTLDRAGFPMEPLLPDDSNAATAEYEVLDAGGFKLLNGGILGLNERFTLTLFGLIGGGGTGSTTYASFIRGKKEVTTNTALDPVNDINKIIQVRGDTSALTITLPSVGDIAANTLIPIEALIGNTKPTTVATSGGQYIYLNNSQKTSIILLPGEVAWLFRDDDGFYIINDYAERYKKIGQPMAAYKAELNQLVCKGQLVARADYPRLWELVQTLGSSLVSDATWSTASVSHTGRTILKPYRGCFSTGDGSTTFRLPDLMNMALRGVKAETGTDDLRYLNKPGGYQEDRTNLDGESISFDIRDGSGGSSTGTIVGTGFSGQDSIAGWVDGQEQVRVKAGSGATETIMENIGVLWVINV